MKPSDHPPPDPTLRPIAPTLPDPMVTALLAFSAGALSLALMTGKDLHDNFRLPQALWIFPTAAWLGMSLANRLSFAGRSGYGWRALHLLVGYLLVSLFSTLGYAFLEAGKDFAALAIESPSLRESSTLVSQEVVQRLPTNFVVFAATAPVGFGVFFVGLLGQFVIAARYGKNLPARARGLRVTAPWFGLASICVFAVFVVQHYGQQRVHLITAESRVELLRSGRLKSEAGLDAALTQAQSDWQRAGGDNAAPDLLSWLRTQPTRNDYVVAQDGSGDFRVVRDALEQVERVLSAGGSALAVRLNALDHPLFTLHLKPGIYLENLQLNGPIRLQGEGPAEHVIVKGPDDNLPGVSLGARDGFIRGPELSNLSVQGGSGNHAISAVGVPASLRIEKVLVGGQGDYCALHGGGLLVNNRFSGRCGAWLVETSNLAKNEFSGNASVAVLVDGDAVVEATGNRFEPTEGHTLRVVGKARLLLADSSIVGTRQPPVVVEGGGQLTLRNALLSARGQTCVWLKPGNGQLVMEASRLDGCGSADYAPVTAQAGTRARISGSVFARNAGRSTLEEQVFVDQGATVEMSGNSIVPPPPPVADAAESNGATSDALTASPRAVDPDLDRIREMLRKYHDTQMRMVNECAAGGVVREGQLSVFRPLGVLNSLLGSSDGMQPVVGLLEEQFSCIRGIMDVEAAAAVRMIGELGACPKLASAFSRYSSAFNGHLTDALVLNSDGRRGRVFERAMGFSHEYSMAFQRLFGDTRCQ